MNILVLTSVYPSPGDKNENVTKVVRYFAQEWAKQGHEVKVVHNVHKYPSLIHMLPSFLKKAIASRIGFYIPDLKAVSRSEFADEGVQVWKMPVFKLYPHGGHPESVIKKHTDRIIKMNNDAGFIPDVIIGHWMSPQAQIIEGLKKIYQCRTALVLHGGGYINNPKFDAKRYLASVDVLGCRSRTQAEHVQQALGLSKTPFVCYSGVPDAFVSEYSFDEEKFAAVPQKWKFIYVGRLVAYKNIDKVLQALSTLENTDYVFDIIGEGAEEANLKKLACDLGITDRVRFHGRMSREDVLKHMREAHCFVMISKGEIFGLVYLEAMAASCIAIGSKDEGIDGVIENRKNGLLCTAADAEELSSMLRELVSSDVDVLQEYARAGFETAAKFTDSNVAKWYLDDVMGW